MKLATILGVAAFVATMGIATSTARHLDEDEAIRDTIEYYFRGGMETPKAFHPNATMYFVRDGALEHVPIQEFLERGEAQAGASGAPASVTKRIVSIDRSGKAAVAKLELRYPDSRIIDYMSLLKIDGTWLIVNKVFERETP